MSQLPDVLARIVEGRRRHLAAEWQRPGPRNLLLDEGPVQTAETNSFLAALEARRGRAVIAEVKMGSPRLGSLAGRFDPEAQARLYAEHGAACLSVVVEPDFFHGSYELLERCREASGLPAIAKDFAVSPRQLLWARDAGASAVLLMAVLFESFEDLTSYAWMARGLGLVPLVEVDSAADLPKLRGAPWELVGVNNRDLRTFEVSLARSIELAKRLPKEALKVAESGISGREQVERLAAAGFDAFLIGESLLTAEDPAAKLEELVG
ncbi:MAG TPA: indole-3-glycerol-phosphate synthase [Thermoanaerobaculia bacterium]|nr:indole-3-glycerol-phosphate synthase [Thermoanaerobaculia bacterium]